MNWRLLLMRALPETRQALGSLAPLLPAQCVGIRGTCGISGRICAMGTARLEAFTDGVVAIIITIMVLEIRVPQGTTLAALQADVPVLLAYVLSYVNVGIFWNNHHHMLHVTERIDGKVLWANLALLFWLSLVPFV